MTEPYQSLFARIAGNGVTDDEAEAFSPALIAALDGTPDPERALENLVKFLEGVPNRRLYFVALSTHEIGLKLLLKVFGTSQYLAELLLKNPEYTEFVANPGVRGGTRSATAYLREGKQIVDACARAELKLDALRRFKAREMLRIGVRDIAGLTDLPRTAREFSNLAEACVQIALEMAEGALGVGRWALGNHPQIDTDEHRLNPDDAPENAERRTPNAPLPFCVIGMGKLGGRELNYSSDIDLMFVCADDLLPEVTLTTGKKMETATYLTRIGEAMIKILTEERNSGNVSGNVFRVDMRLRPEGRFGVLVRSLSGFRAYYESWAEAWEFQALLKARPVAGDSGLGERFLEMVTPFVYRPQPSAEFLNQLRANKRNIERKCEAEGGTERNIKTGYGGIRDIEFLAQLLQIQHGGKVKRLRTPNTLAALHRLALAGFLPETEADELAADYIFLRRVEHALQLFQNRQTQLMPPLNDSKDDSAEIEKLAARLGFATESEFRDALNRHRDHARSTLERRFYQNTIPLAEPDDFLETLQSASAISASDTRFLTVLANLGVRNPGAVSSAFLTAMRGNDFGGMPPDTPEKFLAIVPQLKTLAQNSPNPDAALLGIEALATAVPNRAQLYASFAESPQLLPRLVALAVYAPPMFAHLTRHLEWFELLFEPDEESGEVEPPTLRAADPTKRLTELRRFFLREQLRLVAQDVWGLLDGEDVPRRLTRLAEIVLGEALGGAILPLATLETQRHREKKKEESKESSLGDFASLRETNLSVPTPDTRHLDPPFALVGLGKLGGTELGYSSDWDLLAVYDDRGLDETGRAELARSANHAIEELLKAGKELAGQGTGIELDFRLRPWGKKGALALSLRGYLRYFQDGSQNAAETWERHAAMKARFVAGDRRTGERLVRILHAVSFGGDWNPERDQQLHDMKTRIETERLKPEHRHTDMKLGHGGLLDIEWLTQRLQLLHTRRFPALRVTNTLSALTALASAGLLDRAEADTLRENYELLQSARNALWRLGVHSDTLPKDPVILAPLAAHLGYPDSNELGSDFAARMAHTRRIFERRFNDLR